MTIDLAKGTRDFPPEEKILRQKVIATLSSIFERYGFAPLETPAIERYEVLSAKFGAGESSDAMKEIFTFEDQGGRKLGLRFDFTVPFARYIAMNPEIKMPFKRYQIEKVYRDGPIKLGRYREFWQCDVDIAGTPSMLADAELLDVCQSAFQELGLAVTLDVNNRKILNGILEAAGIPKSKKDQALIAIDKFKKLTKKELTKEFNDKDIDEEHMESLLDILEKTKGSNEEILEQLNNILTSDIGKEGLKEMEELFSYLKAYNVKNVRFNPSLARGLGYYTGPVFEGFIDQELGITSSVCGGGRYDDMIGKYQGTTTKIPATGISFGLEPITEALKKMAMIKEKTPTKVYVIPIGTTNNCIRICKRLREAKIPTDMDMQKRGISKNLAYAHAYRIPFALLVGEDEMQQGKVKLRNMESGKEELLSIEEAINSLLHA
jgi:histidyl-tRNA synthetase